MAGMTIVKSIAIPQSEPTGRWFGRPHDLLWITGRKAFVSRGPLPSWVNSQWHGNLPVVVRRDDRENGLIPIGIRGKTRAERAAAWISPESIRKVVSPESLVSDTDRLAASLFADTRPVQALLHLTKWMEAWHWGVTGSCAYALTTGIPVMHDDSDLDLMIRCPEPVKPAAFAELAEKLALLPCRTDIQIETPTGAFALKEWLRWRGEDAGRRILLKTDYGPILTADPWGPVQVAKREIS